MPGEPVEGEFRMLLKGTWWGSIVLARTAHQSLCAGLEALGSGWPKAGALQYFSACSLRNFSKLHCFVPSCPEVSWTEEALGGWQFVFVSRCVVAWSLPPSPSDILHPCAQEPTADRHFLLDILPCLHSLLGGGGGSVPFTWGKEPRVLL